METALKAGPDASPPYNVQTGLIYQGVFLGVVGLLSIPFQGKQKRRILDEIKMAKRKADVKVAEDAYDLPPPMEDHVEEGTSVREELGLDGKAKDGLKSDDLLV